MITTSPTHKQTSNKVDSVLGYFTFFYLSLPILIFFFGWLRIEFALFLSFVLVAGILSYVNSLAAEMHGAVAIKTTYALLVAGVAFIWVYQSGIGGFANQDWDHHFRNALFRDLITRPWPVYYKFPAGYRIEELANHYSALNYYFTFWLPAAWVGKEFGREAADIFLLLWSYTGILLGFYYLNRLFNFRYSLFTSLLFILWTGLDILGKLIIQKHLVHQGEAIETYYHYFYTSFTLDLYNVFNQFIPTWLITVWGLNFNKRLNLLPITFLFAYAPFPFIGLSLFYYINYTLDQLGNGTTISQFVTDLLNELGKIKIEIVSALCLTITYILFYKAHTSDIPSYLFWTRYFEDSIVRNLKAIVCYFITFFLEVGVYLGIVFLLSKSVYRAYKRPFWITFILLLLIPIWVIGQFNDFASRGSIPCLIFLSILTTKALIDYYDSQQNKTLLFVPATILLLAWVTPFIFFVKSVPLKGSPELREAIGSFADPKVSKETDDQYVLSSMANFYAHEPQQHFFYRYIIKR